MLLKHGLCPSCWSAAEAEGAPTTCCSYHTAQTVLQSVRRPDPGTAARSYDGADGWIDIGMQRAVHELLLRSRGG